MDECATPVRGFARAEFTVLSYCLGFGGWICMVAGGVLVAVGFYLAVLHVTALSWPSVEGIVLSTGIEDKGGRARYAPMVIFRYEVGGVTYESSEIARTKAYSSSKAWAEGKAARFQPGSRVPVFYDPDDPSRGFLDKGTVDGVVAAFGVGVLFVLVGIALRLATRALVRWVCTGPARSSGPGGGAPENRREAGDCSGRTSGSR